MLFYQLCPSDTCKKLILYMKECHSDVEINNLYKLGGARNLDENDFFMIFPTSKNHRKLPPEIPQNYVNDFNEALEVLSISAKASAALCRRCLQKLLREKANVKSGDLNEEIQQVIDSGRLPSDLSGAIDSIRNVGNFSTHPIKYQFTGQIVDVEPGEAEWNIDVLEDLLDFYFVRPAKLQKQREALNQKLQSLGKPPMK